MVATSREGFGIAEEQLWPVPSLDVNSGTDSAAVTLFVERAQNVVSDFSLGQPGETAAVVEICGRLDGIPLAIELAASRMASMTAARCVIGSVTDCGCWWGRGAAWNATTPCATRWRGPMTCSTSAEKALLERCSVFAGGFDLQSACAVMGSDDDYAILDLLDALVRKSLLVADRSAGRTRFSMLETIRQFAEEQLVARGEASEIRGAHSRYFAGREADIMARWDSPRQREAYDWFTIELANLRAAFRWATDHGDLDVAAAIATYVGLLGTAVQTLEPITWAEELIEPARAVDHPRLAFLYVIASLCYTTGRIEAAVGYSDAGQIVVGRSRDALPHGSEAALGAVYLTIGQPKRMAEWCRAQLARRRDTHVYIRAWLVAALAVAGSGGEAMDSADGLIEAAEATGNPMFLSWALFAYGAAFRDANPVGALNALGRGLVIAQDNGHRTNASVLASGLAQLEAAHGDTVSAFDHLTVAIRIYHNAGNTTTLPVPLAIFAALFDRPERYEPAATIAGFALSPIAATGVPEITTAITHLREVLGEATYESLAHKGETMTTAAMATYAYDQIDQARTTLNVVSK